MTVYVGQTRAAKLVRRLWELGIGECTARGELPPRRHPWFYDNGAFGDWQAGRPFDEAQFLADLKTIEGAADKPEWIVLPDRVAAGRDSLLESLRWLPVVRSVAPVYLAVQDGMTGDDLAGVPVDGVFVGGTVEWKIRTAADWVRAARARKLPCHVGRCGGPNKIAWARRIGASSIDSALPLWSEDNLQRFLRALNSKQMDLKGAA